VCLWGSFGLFSQSQKITVILQKLGALYIFFGMNFHFSVGDNLASRFGDFFWFSPFKKISWPLFHTPLVYLFVFGSYLYHDFLWWPFVGKPLMKKIWSNTEWGRFFADYPTE